MSDFNENYWTSRYQEGQTQWDAGAITTPLKTYFDQLTDLSLRILIPGGGSGWEAEYLHRRGFTQVYLLDLSAIPLQRFGERNPDFPSRHLLQADFFALEGQWDLLVEQTFFCALHPSQRPAYAQQAARLLKPGGKLVGLLFNVPLNTDQPPFGGSEAEYQTYFKPHFSNVRITPCYNSIGPRAGREVWIRMVN